MEHGQFKIGQCFYTSTGKWRCTDVGTRTVIAIKLDKTDESWYKGPPYAVAESVFDEYDMEGCSLEPLETGMEGHKRYFIYRITPDGTLHYRESTGNWVKDCAVAQLWANEDFVVKKAKELQGQNATWEKHNGKIQYFIGVVNIQPVQMEWKKL